MTLPLLVSVPHSGCDIPERFVRRCLLSAEQVAEDGDVGAREIYDLAEHVAVFVRTDVARAVLDMNRAEHDRSSDGVVKTHTCWNVPVWDQPLSDADVEWLLEKHYRPYHERLTSAARTGVRLGVDLHTMAAKGPPVGPDPGVERPAVCVSNANGTCPELWIRELRDALEQALRREVRINDPFQGGYITRCHAAELPWMQIELSRAPFATDAEKRHAVFAALEAFCFGRGWR